MPNAKDTLANYLRPYGLDAQDVIDAAWSFVQANPSLSNNSDLIISATRDTQTYKDRFAGNAARVAKGLPELSPATYLQYEEAYRSTLRRAGMPVGFYDTQQDFAKFIGSDIDPTELGTRVEKGYKAVSQADPQIVSEMKRLYGVDDASLAAFFIDPNKAEDIVLRQSAAAQISAQATTQAGLQLSAQEAETLARQGISPTEAQQGFGALGMSKELFTTQAGEEAISQQEQIAGVLGTNAAAAQRVAKRKRERQASFATGGGVAASQKGLTGLRAVGE